MAEKNGVAGRSAAELRRFSDGRSLEATLAERIAALRRWLAENAPHLENEQAHLDADTRERAYWHHGYLTALRDTMDFLQRNPRA